MRVDITRFLYLDIEIEIFRWVGFFVSNAAYSCISDNMSLVNNFTRGLSFAQVFVLDRVNYSIIFLI
jgi:hypothetical protein